MSNPFSVEVINGVVMLNHALLDQVPLLPEGARSLAQQLLEAAGVKPAVVEVPVEIPDWVKQRLERIESDMVLTIRNIANLRDGIAKMEALMLERIGKLEQKARRKRKAA